MRLPTAFAATLFPMPALAHTGHLGEVAGHDHWVAGAAVGIAVGISMWQIAKDRRARRRGEDKEASDAEADAPSGERTA